MDTKKKILLITTGGTIASDITDDGLAPKLSPEEMVSFLPDMEDCELTTLPICNIDSTNVTSAEWKLIVKTIENHYQQYDGFVIAHGTDTMAYTACAISYLIQNPDKPIVITGAQKPIHFDSTDARRNLSDSITYACRGKMTGVVIIFDGEVIAGTRGKKMKTKSYHAFSSINYPYLAKIQDHKIIRYMSCRESGEPLKFYHQISDKVFLLKLTPGMSGDILEPLLAKYDCLILESFGVGGLPDKLSEELKWALKKYGRDEKIIIIATQVIEEESDVSTYAVGRSLNGAINYLEKLDMTLEAVLTKMMWILGIEGLSWEEQERLFYKSINHDITEDIF